MIYQSDRAYQRVFDADFYTVFSDAGFKQQPREALRIKDMVMWHERKRREEVRVTNTLYVNNSIWRIYDDKN